MNNRTSSWLAILFRQLFTVTASLTIFQATGVAEEFGTPLTSEFTTIHRWDNQNLISDAPALVRLEDGTLLCSLQLWSRDAYRGKDELAETLYGRNRCLIFASEDEGKTWQERSRIPFATGKFLQHEHHLYFLGSGIEWEGFWITRSGDGGKTWEELVQLRSGEVYAAATGWVIRDGVLYWAADDKDPSVTRRAVFVMACDLKHDPIDPDSWRFSNDERHPGLPQSLGRGKHNGGKWLEPNVVEANGELLVIVRVRASGGGVDGVVPGIGAICDLDDEDGDLQLRFSHYYPIPGAQNHFHIFHDQAGDIHWMSSNQVTGMAKDTWRGWGKERRFLMLHYSRDAQNWFPAGVLAKWSSEKQSFNYCSPLIDGDDLLFVSRTSLLAANQHDNDSITFHRLPHFRKAAVDLKPEATE